MAKLLSLGLTPPKTFETYQIIHHPIIATEPKILDKTEIHQIESSTLIILTSKMAAFYLFSTYGKAVKGKKKIVSIGKATSEKIRSFGHEVDFEADDPSQEGVIEVLKTLQLEKERILFPTSTLSRAVIDDYLRREKIFFNKITLYKTSFNRTFLKPDLREFDAVYFSSPSCVRFFFQVYRSPPPYIKLFCIGKITEKELERCFSVL